MVDEVLKKEIQGYIQSHNICRIAITDGEKPSSYSMYYVNKGLRIYLESDPISQKIHILQANPYISLTIDEEYADWRQIKGVQLFGRAYILSEQDNQPLDEVFKKKFPSLEELGGIPEHHVFVEIIPEKIYYMDFTQKFGHRSIYYADEEMKEKSRFSW